jgi:hypothetical protein
MARYHLYFFGGSELTGGEPVEAPDDGAAIRIANQRGRGQAVEVWNARSRIGVVAPAMDRHI